jgi:hypothetical protein
MAIEALGLYSLEWPCIWGAPPGSARTLEYRLADETKVHPWSPPELAAVMESAGITPLRALDRSVQAGPKLGTGDYWHGLPAVRPALNRLLVGDGALLSALDSPLPALPAHPAASLHRTLHARRREWLAQRGEGEVAGVHRARRMGAGTRLPKRVRAWTPCNGSGAPSATRTTSLLACLPVDAKPLKCT